MDPTNDAYVMNEKGELIGINEVRNRLINDQPLELNPDANWNHRTSQSTKGNTCTIIWQRTFIAFIVRLRADLMKKQRAGIRPLIFVFWPR